MGYHVQGSNAEGRTIIIEDFWNADPAFDLLLGHEPTMKYVHAAVQGRPTINNSEIRIRYTGNQSRNHGSGAREANGKYRYDFNSHGIDCMMVRMVYFIHDVSNEQGAFCVVPGTHKATSRVRTTPTPTSSRGSSASRSGQGRGILHREPEARGADEPLRPGAQDPARRVRPHFMMSQNIATMDELPYITDGTRARLSEDQYNLFRPYPENGANQGETA